MTTKSQKDGITLRYVVPYLTLLTTLCAAILTTDNSSKILEFDLTRVAAMLAIPSISLMLGVTIQNFLPRAVKETLVFWRINERLPGHRAFSKFSKTDPRIDEQKLSFLGGSEKLSPKKQNQLWYKWYQNYGDEPQVWETGRLYLAYRDLLATSIVVMPFIVAAWLILSGKPLDLLIISTILLIFILFITAVARNKAAEQVTNVLALKSNAPTSEPRIIRPDI